MHNAVCSLITQQGVVLSVCYYLLLTYTPQLPVSHVINILVLVQGFHFRRGSQSRARECCVTLPPVPITVSRAHLSRGTHTLLSHRGCTVTLDIYLFFQTTLLPDLRVLAPGSLSLPLQVHFHPLLQALFQPPFKHPFVPLYRHFLTPFFFLDRPFTPLPSDTPSSLPNTLSPPSTDTLQSCHAKTI